MTVKLKGLPEIRHQNPIESLTYPMERYAPPQWIFSKWFLRFNPGLFEGY